MDASMETFLVSLDRDLLGLDLFRFGQGNRQYAALEDRFHFFGIDLGGQGNRTLELAVAAFASVPRARLVDRGLALRLAVNG